MCWRRIASILILAGSLAACDAIDRLGAERMHAVATEQLCYWRGNPISGRQMMRELARRGEDCTPHPAAMPPAGPQTASMPLPPSGFSDTAMPSPTGLAPQPEPVRTHGAASPPAAPLVTPACAERVLRRGGEDGTAPEARAVMFRNRCDFPIRILYAASSANRLSSLTGLLQPGENSGFAPIEDGFDLPGYVVCSYAAVPTTSACRISSGSG